MDYNVDNGTGSWVNLDSGSASAHVKKYSDKHSVQITINSIKKEITFDAFENKDSVGKYLCFFFSIQLASLELIFIDVWGNLTFKNINKLSPSAGPSYADYNSDRIVFYPQSGIIGSNDFIAIVRLYCSLLIH